jgi:hypothetical protein
MFQLYFATFKQIYSQTKLYASVDTYHHQTYCINTSRELQPNVTI